MSNVNRLEGKYVTDRNQLPNFVIVQFSKTEKLLRKINLITHLLAGTVGHFNKDSTERFSFSSHINDVQFFFVHDFNYTKTCP